MARFFVEQSWQILFPQRRGRSGGVYDEGFALERERYSCGATRTMAGAARALEDLDAMVTNVLARENVRRDMIVLGGLFRGDALSMAYASQNPANIQGVINFAGGWLSEGCGDALSVNRQLMSSPGDKTTPTLGCTATMIPTIPSITAAPSSMRSSPRAVGVCFMRFPDPMEAMGISSMRSPSYGRATCKQCFGALDLSMGETAQQTKRESAIEQTHDE